MTCPGPDSRIVFKRIRIAVLAYILLFVAVGQFLSARRSTDWDGPLRVDVYLVNGDGTAAARDHIESLGLDEFEDVERFFEDEARKHGLPLERPFRIEIAGPLANPPPSIPADGGVVGALIFSLRMRWFATRLEWSNDRWAPDITLFAVYHEAGAGASLDRSTALRKGMIAVAHLFANRASGGGNQMVVAHELLHTLGASDKYDPRTALPVYPFGFADPDRKPRFPQTRAELMAGRIPIRADRAAAPASLAEVMIGPATADEIGWSAKASAAH